MATSFDDTAEAKILAKIEKALRLSENNPNEAEAATALRMAQQLADAYNIDIEGIRSKSGGASAKRHDDLFPGGLYPYQRNLYNAIAKLNHCLYWARRGLGRGQKYQHRLVGSHVNVLMTKQMGEYLQGVVERLARDYVGNDPKLYFTKEAHLFREGVVDRIIDKINDKRKADLEDAKRRKAEEAARSRHPAAAGNALVLIDDVVQREAAANYDFLHGEGAWARMKAREAEREERQRKAAAEYEAWAKANPEEFARQQAEEAERQAKWWREYEKREARNAARRKGVSRPSKPGKYDSAAYWDGNDAGRDVSLDRQVEGGAKGFLR
jgi:hypothetical protein